MLDPQRKIPRELLGPPELHNKYVYRQSGPSSGADRDCLDNAPLPIFPSYLALHQPAPLNTAPPVHLQSTINHLPHGLLGNPYQLSFSALGKRHLAVGTVVGTFTRAVSQQPSGLASRTPFTDVEAEAQRG